MNHNLPDELLDMPLWSLLDHLNAPARVGASLRKQFRQHPAPISARDKWRSSLRHLLTKDDPVIAIMNYRGMKIISTKWLFDTLNARFGLQFQYDWTCHQPDPRPLEALLARLEKVETDLKELKAEWRSLKAIISGKQRKRG